VTTVVNPRLGYRIKFFHEQFGAVPRCFEVTP